MIKPILFNTEMTKAILEDRKTATRRIIRGKNDCRLLGVEKDPELYYTPDGTEHTKRLKGTYAVFDNNSYCLPDYPMTKAPYEPGDILYVRETWAEVDGNYIYKADSDFSKSVKWHPSIFMPKAAARIFLRVVSVNVERLEDIDLKDSFEEGAWNEQNKNRPLSEYRLIFADLWDSTVKREERELYSWEADPSPWVWVVRFEKIEKEEVIRNER